MHQVALVGCAHIHTPGFIERLNKRGDIQVKWVWDHDVERAARRAGELKSEVTGELATIWNDPSIEAVIICSETDHHEPLVLDGAASKKNLFVEKPLGMGGADAYKMARAIDDAGILFHTGYFMRGFAIHNFLREQIQKGIFGKITRARGSNCHSGSLGGWFDTEWRWMADPKQAGVGAFGDLGTHSLDILMWLLGDVASGTATVEVITGRYGDCDETGEAIFKFESGVVGTLAAGWVDVANPVTLLISGTEGHATVVDEKLYLTSKNVEGADGKSAWTQLPEAQTSGFDLFLDVVEGRKDAPLVTAQEAAARSATMEALYRGASEGRWVNVEKG